MIGQGPIFLDAFETLLAEVPFSETQAGAIPVNTAASDGSNPIDKNVIAVLVVDSFRKLAWVSGIGLQSFLQSTIGKLIRPGVRMKVVGADDDERGIGVSPY